MEYEVTKKILSQYLSVRPANFTETVNKQIFQATRLIVVFSLLDHFYLNGEVSVVDSRAYSVDRFVSEFGFQSMPFLRVWKKDALESDLLGGLESPFVKNRQHSMGGNHKVFSQAAQFFIHQDRELEFQISKIEEFIFISQVINKSTGFAYYFCFLNRLTKQSAQEWLPKNTGGTEALSMRALAKDTRWAPCIGS